MNRLLYYFIITMWFVSSCSGGKNLTSSWHDSSKASEEQTSRFTYKYDDETKLFYKITNDDSNLYVSLLADDPNLKRRLLISGIDIWIDSTARGKTTQGVHLASNATASRQQPPLDVQENDRGRGEMENMLIKNMSLETIGLPYELVDYKIFSDSLNGQYFFFSIPLENVSMKNLNPNFISVIIESPSPQMPTQGMRSGGGPQMSGGMGQGRGGGGGMSGGSGRGGGGGPQGGQGGPPSAKKMQEIKISIKKLQLAANGNS